MRSNSGWIRNAYAMAIAAAALLPSADARGGLATAGRLLVDLDARDATAATAQWRNAGALGGAFERVGNPKVAEVAGIRAVQGEAAKGDIVLKLDPQLKGEAYTLDVADRAVVTGAGYPAVAWGTVTLLQALTAKDGKLSLPRFKIPDQPDYCMRAIQMRIPHFSPETGEAALMGDRQ